MYREIRTKTVKLWVCWHFEAS